MKQEENLMESDQVEISPIGPGDVLDVYKLSSQKSVRENSFNQNKIALEDHKKWFAKKLADDNCIMIKAELGGTFVGQVRLEIEGKEALIGISTDEKARGRGVASMLLREAIKIGRKNHFLVINAYIKPSNEASIHLFEKNGWVYEKDEMVSDNLAKKYIYKF